MTVLVNPDLVEKVVLGNRILYHLGVLDGFGHISCRLDNSPEHFLLSANRAPGRVTKDDILCLDLNGDIVNPTDKRSYLERFIHSEIYRSRPDVMSIVHSHSASVIPFGVTGTPLKPIYHMSGFLGGGTALFEIRDAVGEDNDLLIRDKYLGEALAKSLGGFNCVLMRGHGATIVAPSVEVAVFRSYYAESNAKLQLTAMGMNAPITYLHEKEAHNAMVTNEGQIKRAWDLWVGQVADQIE
jgi:HCOMODA/2-hydroxy-3-carboxy-muconic semialdehyde decarboxylase